MDLPDCPPGAEGYEDSVQEPIKKPSQDDDCTKAEHEFQEHLNSLKIKVDDGSARPMVERRGRDISGKWIYLCFPCAAMCSGEAILQTHISGKKHKTKLAMKNVWSVDIFSNHPFVQSEKGKGVVSATESTLQKMAEEVNLHNKGAPELDKKYNKYRNVTVHIHDTLEDVKAPLLGLEYLIEHPPEEAHYEPTYMCTLCLKQGAPRTIVNHLTCFWHRINYLNRHYQKAHNRLTPYRSRSIYRNAVAVIMNRLAQRIEDTYGRQRPSCIEKDEYEKDKEGIHQWIFKSHHFSENSGPTFEDVVDPDLIESLKKKDGPEATHTKDPSPPVVAAPSKPLFKGFSRPPGRNERRATSMDSLSDLSLSEDEQSRDASHRRRPRHRDRRPYAAGRFNPYSRQTEEEGFRSRYAIRNPPGASSKKEDKPKPHNYEYKLKLVETQRQAAVDDANKTLAYHEKNPEKHPLYPEEWKKFWNRRYKEIQGEGKDPSKHDFKPEWIVFWTKRMKEIHDQELRIIVNEVYRKMCLTPPDDRVDKLDQNRSAEARKKSAEPRRRSPDTRRPEPRRRSPEPRRREPEPQRRWSPGRRRSPDVRRPLVDYRRQTPERRHPSADRRRPSLERRPSTDRRRPSLERRPSADRRRPSLERHRPPAEYGRPSLELGRLSPERRRSPERRYSPFERKLRTRSRSPLSSVSQASRQRPHIELESLHRRSQSPLSKREQQMRNRSPAPPPAPVAQCVLISDDELNPDNGGASPWNSDSSLGSLPDARSPLMRPRSRDSSVRSRASRQQRPRDRDRDYAPARDRATPDDVVGTLRLLVALEDYLGSLGPKIVDLLTEALKMEKEKANSSEELLEREGAVAIMETAKEKLKGAVQAGLVPSTATSALRQAVVRVASMLHEADKRASIRKKLESNKKPETAVPVAGVGQVDRAQIAQQMAAALIAQGKTDVSSEELAQLVDAVVGMAEAKKRQEAQKKLEQQTSRQSVSSRAPAVAVALAPGASALQMLQSAYDENDTKKVEKEKEAPDAMDGLSDSDLETLLKNFNELSAEEQHSLIAYLKKLEAKEPRRVERLREYVSEAATTAVRPPAPMLAPAAMHKPAPASTPAPAPAPRPSPPPPPPPAVAPAAVPASAPKPAAAAAVADAVTIESDDDDYTVEEVFKSVTQKVKEDQIRQEMEIVTMSLKEAKPETPAAPEKAASPAVVDVPSISNRSSAANLLAMVQASLAKVQPTQSQPISAVVSSVSHTQPRSFGDLPEASADTNVVPMVEEDSYHGSDMVEDTSDSMHDRTNAGNIPMDSYDNVQSDNSNWPVDNMADNMGSNMGNNFQNDNMGNNFQSMNDNMGNNMGYNYDNMPNDNMANMNYNNMGNMQADTGMPNMPMNNVNNMQNDPYNQGPPMGNNQWTPNQRPNAWEQPTPRPNHWESGPPIQQNRPYNNFNQGPGPGPRGGGNFNSRGGMQNDNFNNRGGMQNDNFNNRGGMQNDNFNNRGGMQNDNFNNRGGMQNDNFNQGPRGGGNFNSRGGMQNDSFNKGPRGGGNFNNRGGKQNDNFNQFGNKNEQRGGGRGRGRGGGGGGRGRRGRF